MNINLDTLIVIIFLASNLIVGFRYGRGVNTIRDYALGGQNFSTGALVSTIVATIVGGGFFFTTLSKTYSDGLYYLIASSCGALSIFIVAIFFTPRMGGLLGKTSIAEYMGDFYGDKVRVIVAIAGTIGSVGAVAVQFQAFGNVFNYFLNIDNNVAIAIGYITITYSNIVIIISGCIVTTYSAFGGVRSVTFTDVLQFITFGIAMPLIGIMIWKQINHPGFSFANTLQDPRFNIGVVLNIGNPKFWDMIPLMLYFALPEMEPAFCQRISMGKNLDQIKKAFMISAFLILALKFIVAWIPFLMYNVNPDLPAKKLLGYIIDNYTYPGFKALIIVGVTALAMSTADSAINSSSVLFANDFCRPLKIGFNKELLLSKLFSILLGIGGIFLALRSEDLLSIVLAANSYYMPIVTTPMITTIFGFRTTKLSILTGMAAGFITVILWNVLGIEIDCIVIAMLVNLVFLLGTHYLLRQQGGWINTKTNEADNYPKQKGLIGSLSEFIKSFNFVEFCKKNAPTNELTYTSFGIYCFFCTLTTMYNTSAALIQDSSNYILVIFQVMMVTSVLLAIYPIWPARIKKDLVIQVAWNIIIFYMLIFFGSYFALVNKFSTLQFVVFTINMIVIAIISNWRVAAPMTIIGFYLGTQFYKYSLGLSELNFDIGSPQAVLVYTLLLASTAILIFLKPKQEQYDLTEQKADHLSGRIEIQEQQLYKALGIKEEFIRNVQHEYHTPMTGVISLSQALLASYQKMPLEKLGGYLESIYKSALRIDSYDNNINMLSKLSKTDYTLNLEQIDLSSLLYDRIATCRKLYEQNREDREFIYNVEDDITANIDKEYFTKLLDNLVVNAINYCKEGQITITLKRDSKHISLTIADEGIGIPEADKEHIFGNFTVSSKTWTPAGGRGVGLALCKRVMEVHNGRIEVESDGIKGAIFKLRLPVS